MHVARASLALVALAVALTLGLILAGGWQGIALQNAVVATGSTRLALDLALRCAALVVGATVIAAAAASYVRE